MDMERIVLYTTQIEGKELLYHVGKLDASHIQPIAAGNKFRVADELSHYLRAERTIAVLINVACQIAKSNAWPEKEFQSLYKIIID